MSESSPERIVSLAPSATAVLDAIGAADRLVGLTRHCEVNADPEGVERPDSPAGRPAVVGGWPDPDYEAVASLDPDLVVTVDDLQRGTAADLRERGHRVFHAAPATLGAVLESFADLGAAVGLPAAGEALAARSRERLDRTREAVAGRERPVVYCEEWSEPPMAAGNWVPEAVEVAGGRYPFLDPGERSREVGAESVEAARPDHAVLHVCGHGVRTDPAVLTDRGWDLPAVERGNVHVLDDSLLNRPGPGLVDGVETLAATLHSEAFEG